MDSTRALFASIGVSVSLVAAAALSLFVVSAVIAFGGWSAGMGDSGPATTLVFGESAPPVAMASKAHNAHAAPVVLRAQAAPQPRKSSSATARAVAQNGSDARARVISHSVAVTHPAQVQIVQPPAVRTPPAVHIPAVGDSIRHVGAGLSSTAQNTGKALADVTAPLGPPVSAAVQKVLDLVAVLLRRTTNGVAGTIDASTGQR